MSLHKHEDRVPPVRGLVLTRNARGKPFAAGDIRRWLRLNRTAHNSDKADLLVLGNLITPIGEFLSCANELGMRLSVRTDCTGNPYNFASLKQDGLYDVFLTPAKVDADFERWLDAVRAAALPVRIQLHVPFAEDLRVDRFLKTCAAAEVASVNLAISDPFVKTGRCRDGRESRDHIKMMMSLASAFDAYDIEANLVGLPFCQVTEDHRPRVLGRKQFFLDHQQYVSGAYDLAEKLSALNPVVAGKVLLMLLGQHTLFKDPIDAKLFPWLLKKPWLRARAVAAHRLTRHKRLTHSVPKPIEESEEAYEREIANLKNRAKSKAGKICGECALQLICDGDGEEFRRVLPGLKVKAFEGDLVANPMHFAGQQRKYYDAIDTDRIQAEKWMPAFAERAASLTDDRAPNLEIDSLDYSVEGEWSQQLPGGLRWFGLTNTEKLSTPLAKLDPPFAVAATFGGGIAEYIGFSLNDHAKVLCPMDGYQHRLMLYVEADGRYVLTRDGVAVRPQQFRGNYYVPQRLGDGTELRISIWNINYSLVTQNVCAWSESLGARETPSEAKYSVVVVCVKYARRLQTVLQCIANQHGIDPSEIEVIVAYVPGLDATEDVIEAVRLAYPDLQLRRSPFPPGMAMEKGLMINESVSKASGEWIVLLDADTLLPPDFFVRTGAIANGADFLVPDGRKMLDKEVTAEVLLGEIRPWKNWDELMGSAGEFRHREMEGVPIGFCQCVRKSCFEKVSYYEAAHFEGADWQFSVDMRKAFGPEKRISGAPVLHLDHGGSQWYGTKSHL